MNRSINISDYTYTLPQDRIALFPLEKRDASKLLVYRNGEIIHQQFSSILDFIPSNTILFFNDTKVIPARLHFQKDTGATIEIFLLHPIQPSALLVETIQAKETVTWHCTIGNLKRWTEGSVLIKKIGDVTLTASLQSREQGIVELRWDAPVSFAEIISKSGETPLPPYLKREVQETDKERYQTIYAQYDGAVAAPTAGLHFTPAVLERAQEKGIQTEFLTLHVSAGTFQPVKVEDATQHTMHNEQVVVQKKTILTLLQDGKFILPVGTTSTRTLESLYWYGVKLLRDHNAAFVIRQHDPYNQNDSLPAKKEALQAVLNYMQENKLDTLIGETSIYIMPGYTFRVCDALITNFHQPGSTLMLLVAALVGDDWKRIYSEALANAYRFLSYGDSSLLFPNAHK